MSATRIYLDWASAAPLSADVVRAYTKALALFGNASAAHAEGRAAKNALTEARTIVARTLSVKPDELVLTSGGTESNNIAIMGVALALHMQGRAYTDMHGITTTIEHSSVLETFKILELWGVRVTYLAPTKDGIVSADAVVAALTENTVLVSMAHVTSESGTVQPVAEIGSRLQKMKHGAVLHVDAAQSPLYFDAGPHALRAHVVSYDAQKVGGPKGVGFLYRSFSVPLVHVLGGGTQERGIRPGTENVPAAVAAAAAFAAAAKGRKARAAKVAKIRDYLAELIAKEIPQAQVIGGMKRRTPNNLFLAIPNVDGDYVSVLMDKDGVAVTPRSACVGSGGGHSATALALTGDVGLARGTVRFSLGPTTTKADVAKAAKVLAKAIKIAQSV